MERSLWLDEIRLNISFLRLLGLLPAGGRFTKSDPYTYLTIFVISYSAIHVTCQAMYLTVTYTDLEQATLTIFFCVPSYLSILKMTIVATKAKMLNRLLQSLNEEIFQPSVEQMLVILPDIRIWKIIHRGLMAICTVAVVLYCALPILTGSVKEFELPLPAWYPYDTRRPFPYALTYVFQIMGTYFVSYGTYNIDMFISALMMYVGTQCDILCDNLRNLGSESSNFAKGLEGCVVHHKTILLFAEKCNEFFNIIMLAQFFGCVICLSFSLFRLAVVAPFTFEFYYYSCVVSIFIMESFSYCWFGNGTQAKSEDITYALFESFWITQSLADKKSMIIFAERAQIPIRLSTFQLFYFNLETFVKILRSAVSYFTILRQLTELST